MDGRLPLSALLSHALVAFTVEFDNEFERAMPHRTTIGGSRTSPRVDPWLVSMAMWSNFMQFVGDDGVTVRDLQRLARITRAGMVTSLAGMQRWGYVVVEPAAAGANSKRARPDAVIRPTAAGRRARELWPPLFGLIEERWRARAGDDEIDGLRASLGAVVGQLDVEMPDYLPMLRYGLFVDAANPERTPPAGEAAVAGCTLPALLSKVLLAFALDFERDSAVSLAIGANVLRLVGADSEHSVRVRDLPRRAAVSKEAIAMSVGFLQKHGYGVVEPESPGSRVRRLTLTANGRRARDAYRRLVWTVEERWRARFGEAAVSGLRGSLERLAGGPAPTLRPPTLQVPQPYPDGWRASVPPPEGLPHHPMVLHRGGFPDGS